MILLLLAAVSDPEVLLSNARARLFATCRGAGCASAPSPSRFRVDGDGDGATDLSAKDRAIRDDGSKCNVVGARRCTKRGRTIFSTDFTR